MYNVHIEPIKHSLENEKKNFLKILCSFIDNIDFNRNDYFIGRPRADYGDVIKCLLIMSYHCWSYRRANYDIEKMYEDNLISTIPKRSTLNKYMNDEAFREVLEKLIEKSALPFLEVETCVILDSTWYSNKIKLATSSYKVKYVRENKLSPNAKTRKLHIIIGRHSKVILCARTSFGTVHDNKFFEKLLDQTLKNGFKVRTLLADKGYGSRQNYILCEDNGIEAFIDFKSSDTERRSLSTLRKKQLRLLREEPTIWYQTYNFRPLVEMVFSVMKRTGKNYLRSRTDTAQDCEMLLRALWYNLNVVAKYYY